MGIKVKIWTIKMKCYNCKEIIDVTWPEEVDLDLVGQHLTTKSYAHISKVFSKTQNQAVWGNVCPLCDAYQGNFVIGDEFLNVQYFPGESPYYGRLVESIDVEIPCGECGKLSDESIVAYSNLVVCPQCFEKIQKE
jgi:phage FluMu protein Com